MKLQAKPAPKRTGGGKPAALSSDNAERWRLALEGAGEGVWDWDLTTGRVFFSHQWKHMLGYEDAEISDEFTEWEKRVHPDDLAGCLEAIRNHLSGDASTYASEHRILCKNGSYKWILDRGRVVSRASDGRPLRVVGTHSDIQQLKEAEELLGLQRNLALRLSATRDLKSAFAIILDTCTTIEGFDCGGVYLVDPERGGIVLAYHRGISAPYARSSSFFPAETPEGRIVMKGDPHFYSRSDLFERLGRHVAEEGLTALAVLPLRHHGETIASLNIASHSIAEISGYARQALTSIAFLLGDSIVRLRTEEELSESEQKFRALFTNDIFATAIVSLDEMRYLDVNEAFVRLYGYTRDEILGGMTVRDITAEPEATEASIKRMATGPTEFIPIRYHRRKDGTHFPTEIAIGSYMWRGKRVMFAMIHDISDRVHSEQGIAQLLREKQVLLKEVHHRIKNNLMTVASMLSLEATASTARSAGDILHDARQRIETMGRLYETVYRTTDFTTIGTSTYLTGIANDIARTFAGSHPVGFHTDIADCSMDTKKLYLVGIIIYELLTNAYKYAFEGATNGDITVALRGAPGNTLLLEVSDNGVGIPREVIDGTVEGFGYSLIRMFVRQIDGTLAISGTNGTTVSIHFPG